MKRIQKIILITISLYKIILNDHKKYFSLVESELSEGNYYSESKEMGTCPCDITPGVCDFRCCCDSDCSKGKCGNSNKSCKDLWEDDPRGVCLNKKKEEYLNHSDYLCSIPKKIYKKNTFQSYSKYNNPVDNLLCVQWSRASKDMNEFYRTVVDDDCDLADDTTFSSHCNSHFNTKLYKIIDEFEDENNLDSSTTRNLYAKRNLENNKFNLNISENNVVTNNSIPIYMYQKNSEGYCVYTKIISFEDFSTSCIYNEEANITELSMKDEQKQKLITNFLNETYENINIENKIGNIDSYIKYYIIDFYYDLNKTDDKNINIITNININFLYDSNIPKKQYFSIRWHNASNNFTLGGKFGYSLNKPLIVVNSNNEINENGYFLLMKFKDENQTCKKYEEDKDDNIDFSLASPILFGKNIYRRCTYQVDKNTNDTLQIFPKENSIVYISRYGNTIKDKLNVIKVKVKNETNIPSGDSNNNNEDDFIIYKKTLFIFYTKFGNEDWPQYKIEDCIMYNSLKFVNSTVNVTFGFDIKFKYLQ